MSFFRAMSSPMVRTARCHYSDQIRLLGKPESLVNSLQMNQPADPTRPINTVSPTLESIRATYRQQLHDEHKKAFTQTKTM
ncbi:hypothetical protein Ppro_0555 [Pelobacter propionicus DSM 2379]|uniref:Uncharacterized protein n=1 Tax=Pelobacter propionicus (strain DSM 2379 / NBRC 103807 / OttBd1) TaxID=338966 RepID=A1ALG6_PELPD|nr:hypothetical protein Ppro_0555 [Pelobacter propionicus DSM 2379]